MRVIGVIPLSARTSTPGARLRLRGPAPGDPANHFRETGKAAAKKNLSDLENPGNRGHPLRRCAAAEGSLAARARTLMRAGDGLYSSLSGRTLPVSELRRESGLTVLVRC